MAAGPWGIYVSGSLRTWKATRAEATKVKAAFVAKGVKAADITIKKLT